MNHLNLTTSAIGNRLSTFTTLNYFVFTYSLRLANIPITLTSSLVSLFISLMFKFCLFIFSCVYFYIDCTYIVPKYPTPFPGMHVSNSYMTTPEHILVTKDFYPLIVVSLVLTTDLFYLFQAITNNAIFVNFCVCLNMKISRVLLPQNLINLCTSEVFSYFVRISSPLF